MYSSRHYSSRHTAFQSIPVVDITGLRADHPATRQATAANLGQAAREAGFFYLSGHGIPTPLIERLQARTRDYFAQPLAEKMRDYIGQSHNHSGYVPEGEEQFYGGKVDKKEAYDVGFDLTREPTKWPMVGANQWPSLPGFKEDVKAYYDAALALGQHLFRGFALALGLPETTFTDQITTPPSQLRLIHYPFDPDTPADRPGIGAHTDYECFTLLLPTAPGLEVMNGAGEWIDVPVKPGCFVVNIGDMMEVLSNGAFVATSHRVRKVAEERYSFPLFCSCDYDTVIAPVLPPAEGVTNDRYQPVVCGEHLYAQTIQTFRYLRDQWQAGTLALPDAARALASFGRLADNDEAERPHASE
ncbi:2OG-Fe(II) oxygenase superfamily [Alloalcanivorax dieselolei B5]|uniref:2-oxoglutarate-dependent ethylene/succinate-forming enzyme n=1 Tax=Alcanivorax dieselolei (strain DSM 16502 / CGMCC 1.3690 / MCCC 1A00001 / B-5) TaxID=930169 RepID=K0CC58_ALCDB|nr:2-oxoglutarate and iron-dependent oxygenase domain-containing protein [Alloalcanivorax dieselolei]AFT71149.1 2OG-Fe(II) oxygenase superfamily [Alloalcanivorax dieselolei B5]GGJ93489.1 2OG-Fe(II) oxygenase [Alloalcanivorax dieselolei]